MKPITMSKMHQMQVHHRVPEAKQTLNHNFQIIDETFDEHRLCITTLNNLVEQQQKEIEELKQDSQTHYDAFGHNHVRLTAIEESSKVTVHEVQQLKEESQAHFDAFAIHRTAIADLQTQIDAFAIQLNHLQFLSKLLK